MIIMKSLYELQPIRADDAKNVFVWVTKQIFFVMKWFFSLLQWKNIPDIEWYTIGLTTLWSIGYWIFLQWEFGSLYVMICILIAMFINLGERKKGELSAYSVFNKGFRNLPGQLRGEDLDREIRHGFQGNIDDHSHDVQDDSDFVSEAVDENDAEYDSEVEVDPSTTRKGSFEKPSQKMSNGKGFDNTHDVLVEAAIQRLKRRIQKN